MKLEEKVKRGMFKALVIGGSAGSLQSMINLGIRLKYGIRFPIFVCLHRLKNQRHGIVEALTCRSAFNIREPDDKEPVRQDTLYLAPANYHMRVHPSGYISLSCEEMVHYSRPSIDVLFNSAAETYGPELMAILLSGANQDGSEGVRTIRDHGGILLIQDPDDCEIGTMTGAALKATEADACLSAEQIIDFVSLFLPSNNAPS